MPNNIIVLAILAGLGTTPALAQTSSEIGAPAGGGLNLENLALPDFSPRYHLRLGADHIIDEELRESYGLVPGAELGVTVAISRYGSFFANLGYFRSEGDPYFDLDGLSDEEGLLLQTVPLTVGFMLNASQNPHFRLNFGGGLGPNYVRERVPGLEEDLTADGLVLGWRYFVRPEFNLGRGALGLELGVGGSKGRLRGEGHGHDIDLWAFQPRIVYTLPWR
jgi:hypothetical protein